MKTIEQYMRFLSPRKLEGIAKTSFGYVPFQVKFTVSLRMYPDTIIISSPDQKTDALWQFSPGVVEEIKKFIEQNWDAAWKRSGPFMQIRKELKKYPETSPSLWKSKVHKNAVFYSLMPKDLPCRQASYSFDLFNMPQKPLEIHLSVSSFPSMARSNTAEAIVAKLRSVLQKAAAVEQVVRQALQKESVKNIIRAIPFRAYTEAEPEWNVLIARDTKLEKRVCFFPSFLIFKTPSGRWVAEYYGGVTAANAAQRVQVKGHTIEEAVEKAISRHIANLKKNYPGEVLSGEFLISR
jgi:hypothetical protein